MTIETSCQRCPTWVRIITPDTTSEAEASRLADRCYCLACGIERMVEHTTHHEAMRETSHVLPPKNVATGILDVMRAHPDTECVDIRVIGECEIKTDFTAMKTNANVPCA